MLTFHIPLLVQLNCVLFSYSGVRRFVDPNKFQRGRVEQLTPHKLQFFDDLFLKVSFYHCAFSHDSLLFLAIRTSYTNKT